MESSLKPSSDFPAILRLPTLLALLALVSACASPPSDGTTANSQMNCTRETPTGTSIPVVRCRTPQQVERDRESAEELGKSIRAAPGSTAGSTSGR